jgi:broad specificity phosphatase PhoE
MINIYFIRHGKTDYSGNRLCGNLPGIHLNETGRNQAALVAAYFTRQSINAIYSSPMERAIETAQPTARQQSLPIEKVDFLREIDFGDYQGKGKELQQDVLWKRFLSTPAEIRFPNGETIAEAQKRVVEGLDQLCLDLAENAEILCTAHCEIIRLAIAHALGMSLELFMRLTIETGSISRVAWGENTHKVFFINQVPH